MSATVKNKDIVGSATLVFKNSDRTGLILGVSRKEDKTDFGLPGGKREPGEEPWQTAIRETLEETGYTVRLVNPKNKDPFFVRPSPRTGRYVAAFVCEIVPEVPRVTRKLPGETGLVRWISEKKLVTEGCFAPYNSVMMKVYHDKFTTHVNKK